MGLGEEELEEEMEGAARAAAAALDQVAKAAMVVALAA